MNDSRFNSDRPTFVFSTSQEKMLLASKIQRNSKFLLEKEYCHFDGKYGRVRGMKTFVATAQNTYYHADVSCIKENNPNFKSVMLEISTDVKNSLKGEHKAYYDNILTLHRNVISNFSVKIYGNVFLIAHKCNTRCRRFRR